MKRYRIKILFLLAAMTMVVAACAPNKAVMDKSMYKGIIWPGPPEKPRVEYLWSLRQVSGGGGGKVLEVLAGKEGFDEAGSRGSSFLSNPQGVFVGGKGMLYVAEAGAGRVSVVDLQSLDSFNIQGDRDFKLLTPIGVAADKDGNIYVSDAGLKMVVVFNEEGRFKLFFEGPMERPTGIAIDLEASRVYVADTWAHMVHVYGLDGARKLSIGGEGEGDENLHYPTHIALDLEGNLYVADTLNFKVKVFAPSGDLLHAFGIIGDSYRSFDKIKGIAVDTEGHIYVTDSAQDMVKIFDREGRLLLFFGEKGSFHGQFSHPAGIFIDRSDRIFVADMLNGRIQAFQFLGGG
jgi:sugar lactone lactonase YvrE